MPRIDKDTYIIAGNVYNKYESKNPVTKFLMKNFLNSLDEILKTLGVKKILEVGCGEGYLTNYIKDQLNDIYIEGCDVSENIINIAREIYPDIPFFISSAYKTAYKNSEFDLVIASEVLEHLDRPHKALEELSRITNRYCLFSVPWEPMWRILNLTRGKYLKHLGNTPGHVQHWTRKDFTSLLKDYFRIKELKKPFPWTMVLCEKVY